MAAPAFDFREVTPERWGDLEELFEARGGPKNCWCMVWRTKPPGTRHADASARKALLQARVAAAEPVGLLGYAGDRPIAWCSIAPRPTYRNLGGPAAEGDPNEIWSLTCFFVSRDHRGQGVSRALLGAAVEAARRHGATILESYPVDPSSPSYRFMGFVRLFEKAGFKKIGLAGLRRYVMRLALDKT